MKPNVDIQQVLSALLSFLEQECFGSISTKRFSKQSAISFLHCSLKRSASLGKSPSQKCTTIVYNITQKMSASRIRWINFFI